MPRRVQQPAEPDTAVRRRPWLNRSTAVHLAKRPSAFRCLPPGESGLSDELGRLANTDPGLQNLVMILAEATDQNVLGQPNSALPADLAGDPGFLAGMRLAADLVADSNFDY